MMYIIFGQFIRLYTFVSMRRFLQILFIMLLMVPLTAGAINRKKQKLIVPGRWRETVRMTPDSTVTPFTDTLFMHFFAKDSFSYHYRKGFIYEGVYLLSEDSILNLGTASYKVLSRTTDELVMFNAKGIYRFVTDSSDTVKTIVLRKNDSTLPVTDIDIMIGRWTVYKRTADGPGRIDPDENIRSAYITGPSSDGRQGFIYGTSDPDSQPSWFIKELGGGQSLNCSGKNNRTLKVVRCQDGEMILEENKIKYYFKMYQ